jgi:uncharacterized zinc-type alcohol dehydrogenase-like protein
MSKIHAYAAKAPKSPLQPFEFDPGELGPDQVEIKVTHCGICHSDLSMLDNEWGMSQFPLVPGHEAVGSVLALGENAKGLRVGQRVGVGWSASSCLSCRECLSGHHNLCANSQGTIVGRHGGFADRLRAQWAWVRPIPDTLDLAKAGPLLCGGVTVFNPFLAYNISPTARWASSASADWVTWHFNLPTNGVAKFMFSRPATAKKRRHADSEPMWYTTPRVRAL